MVGVEGARARGARGEARRWGEGGEAREVVGAGVRAGGGEGGEVKGMGRR